MVPDGEAVKFALAQPDAIIPWQNIAVLHQEEAWHSVLYAEAKLAAMSLRQTTRVSFFRLDAGVFICRLLADSR